MPDFLAEALTWPQNYSCYVGLRTALTWSTPPTQILLDLYETKFGKRFTKLLDRRLKLAYQILQDETCSRCGVVSWHGRSTNNVVQFKIEQSVCEGCAAVDTDQKERSKDKHKEDTPGATRYAQVEHAFPGERLPGRDDWIQEMRIDRERQELRRRQQEEATAQ